VALEMSISGGARLERLFRNLAKAETGAVKKEVRREVRAEIKPIRRAARAAAPARTGRLRRAIKARAWKRPARGEVGMKVLIDRGASRDDPRGAYYGAMVNSGYVRGGRAVAGAHFMERAARSEGPAAAKAVSKAMARAIRRAARGK